MLYILGGHALLSILCHNCKKESHYEEPVGRSQECPSCLYDVRVCFNCNFWDPSYSNQCRENQADYVKDKDKSNYCEYFRPRPSKSSESNMDPTTQKKLDDIFSNLPSDHSTQKSKDDNPLDALESLFKKKK